MKTNNLIIRIKRMIYKLKNLSRRQKRKYVKIGFFIFGLLLLLNISIMTVYLIDQTYDHTLFKTAYTHAVLPEQSLNQKLKLDVVKYKRLPFNDIKVGDKVIVDGDFNLDIYWVETVVAVDHTAKTIKTSYDYEVASTYHEDDIVGMYIKDANFFGTIYFSASFLRGYTFITLTHCLLLYAYYSLLIHKEDETTI